MDRTDRQNDDAWLDLVVSILAVNQYSIEKTYEGIDGLREHHVCDPLKLAHWDHAQIIQQLKLAGYDRGEFMTNLFALRLGALGAYIRQHGVEASSDAISSRDRIAVERFLSPVNGVGPKVLKNFFMLRGI